LRGGSNYYFSFKQQYCVSFVRVSYLRIYVGVEKLKLRISNLLIKTVSGTIDYY